MSDPVSRLVEAIDRKDARGIRDADAPTARCGPREGAPEPAGADAGTAS